MRARSSVSVEKTDLFVASFGQFRAKDIADTWNIANAFVTERFSHEFTEFLGRRRTHRW